MLRLGLHQSDGQPVGKYAPQYILGASDVSPQGVAQAYGVLAADGKKCSMMAVTKVSQGSKVLAEPKTSCTQVVDPDVVHGRPAVRGTRVRVTDVLSLLAAGAAEAEILADYPYLTSADIRACLEYAAAQADHAVLRAS